MSSISLNTDTFSEPFDYIWVINLFNDIIDILENVREEQSQPPPAWDQKLKDFQEHLELSISLTNHRLKDHFTIEQQQNIATLIECVLETIKQTRDLLNTSPYGH